MFQDGVFEQMRTEVVRQFPNFSKQELNIRISVAKYL
jgi:hypothetical protein